MPSVEYKGGKLYIDGQEQHLINGQALITGEDQDNFKEAIIPLPKEEGKPQEFAFYLKGDLHFGAGDGLLVKLKEGDSFNTLQGGLNKLIKIIMGKSDKKN